MCNKNTDIWRRPKSSINRNPDKIELCSMEEDAKRRDFTINGLFLDPIENKIYDFVGGNADLVKRVVRFIGEPEDRIKEDPLRMLRAARFMSNGFSIDPLAQEIITRNKYAILSVSNERIFGELTKLIRCNFFDRGLSLLQETGILKLILPELDATVLCEQPEGHHPEGDVWDHSMLTLHYAKQENNASDALLWGALLHDIGKPLTKDGDHFYQHHKVGADLARIRLMVLKTSTAFADQVCSLIYNHMKFMDIHKMKKSTLKRFFQLEKFEEHLALHKADCQGSFSSLDTWDIADNLYRNFEPEEIKPLSLLTGNDLIGLGYEPGPLFRTILEDVMNLQLEDVLNDKESAIEYVKNKYRR